MSVVVLAKSSLEVNGLYVASNVMMNITRALGNNIFTELINTQRYDRLLVNLIITVNSSTISSCVISVDNNFGKSIAEDIISAFVNNEEITKEPTGSLTIKWEIKGEKYEV